MYISGARVSTTIFSCPGVQIPVYMRQSCTGDLIISGNSTGSCFGSNLTGTAFSTGLLMRVSTNGTLIWGTLYSGISSGNGSFGSHHVNDAIGQVVVAGKMNDLIQMLSFRLTDGSLYYTKTFPNSGSAGAVAVSTSLTDYFIGGYDSTVGGAFVSKLNLNGTVYWYKTFGTGIVAIANVVLYDELNDIVYGIGSTSAGIGTSPYAGGNSDIINVGICGNGSTLFAKSFGNTGSDSIYGAFIHPTLRLVYAAGIWMSTYSFIGNFGQSGSFGTMYFRSGVFNDAVVHPVQSIGLLADSDGTWQTLSISGTFTSITSTGTCATVTLAPATTTVSTTTTTTSATVAQTIASTITSTSTKTLTSSTIVSSTTISVTATPTSTSSAFGTTSTSTFSSSQPSTTSALPSSTLAVFSTYSSALSSTPSQFSSYPSQNMASSSMNSSPSTSASSSISTTTSPVYAPTSSVTTQTTSISETAVQSTLTSSILSVFSMVSAVSSASSYVASLSSESSKVSSSPVSTSTISTTKIMSSLDAPSVSASVDSTSSSPSGIDVNGAFNTGISSMSSFVLIVTMVTVASATILFSVMAIFFYRRMRKATQVLSNATTTASGSTNEFSSSQSDTKTNMSIVNSTDLTLQRTEMELAVPAFLLVELNEDIRIEKQLAQGGCGSVYLGSVLNTEWPSYGSKVVVKMHGKSGAMPISSLNNVERRLFDQELSIMYYLRNSPYIAKMIAWCDKPTSIVMKHYSFGSLDKWVANSSQLRSKRMQTKFAMDIALGIYDMHKAGFVHCDLKPQNILLDIDDNLSISCVLTDFGISQIVDSKSLLVKEFQVSTVKGLSYLYAAPEVFLRFRERARPMNVGGDMLRRADVYSFGVILYEIFNLQRATYNLAASQLLLLNSDAGGTVNVTDSDFFTGSLVSLSLSLGVYNNMSVYIDTGPYLKANACSFDFTSQNLASPQAFLLYPLANLTRSSILNITLKYVGYQDNVCVNGSQIFSVNYTRMPLSPCTLNSKSLSVSTFDGYSYSFPGSGGFYYSLVVSNDNRLVVQGYLDYCGAPSTCFTGLAVAYGDSSLIFNMANTTANTFNQGSEAFFIYADESCTYQYAGSAQSYCTVTLTLADGTIISLQPLEITYSYKYIARITIQLSGMYKNSVSGICGNFDTVSSNDSGVIPTIPVSSSTNYLRCLPNCAYVNTSSLIENSELSCTAIDRNCIASSVLAQPPSNLSQYGDNFLSVSPSYVIINSGNYWRSQSGSVVLSQQPSNNVYVALSASNSVVVIDNCYFIFNPLNWNVSQLFNVFVSNYHMFGFTVYLNAVAYEDVSANSSQKTCVPHFQNIPLVYNYIPETVCRLKGPAPLIYTFDGAQVDLFQTGNEGTLNIIQSEDQRLVIQAFIANLNRAGAQGSISSFSAYGISALAIRFYGVKYGFGNYADVLYSSSACGTTVQPTFSGGYFTDGSNWLNATFYTMSGSSDQYFRIDSSDGTMISGRIYVWFQYQWIYYGCSYRISNRVFDVNITLPGIYSNNIKGMCGNFDGVSQNDIPIATNTSIVLVPSTAATNLIPTYTSYSLTTTTSSVFASPPSACLSSTIPCTVLSTTTSTFTTTSTQTTTMATSIQSSTFDATSFSSSFFTVETLSVQPSYLSSPPSSSLATSTSATYSQSTTSTASKISSETVLLASTAAPVLNILISEIGSPQPTSSSQFSSSSTLTPTGGDSNNQNSSSGGFTGFVLIMTVSAVSIAAVISGTIAFLAFRRMRRARQALSHATPTKSLSKSSTSDKSNPNDKRTNISAIQTTNMTLQRTDMELSVPAFLLVDLNETVRIQKELARGGCGTVFIGEALNPRWHCYRSPVVVKVQGLGSGTPFDELTPSEQKMFQQEVAIMYYLRNSPFIAGIVAWCQSPTSIIMKYYSLGSLDKWIDGDGLARSRRIQMKLARDITCGILVMHKAGFVHCDLKPQNILLSRDDKEELCCVLTDFGITQVVDPKSLLVQEFQVSTVKGLTVNYAAPEVFLKFRDKKKKHLDINGDILKRGDVYSFGVILYEMSTLQTAWDL